MFPQKLLSFAVTKFVEFLFLLRPQKKLNKENEQKKSDVAKISLAFTFCGISETLLLNKTYCFYWFEYGNGFCFFVGVQIPTNDDLFDRFKVLSEKIHHVKIFEFRLGHRIVEINSVMQIIDFNVGLRLRR